ncbi:MAG: excalibur calcium-binding domain-containing protein [Kribbellaceae bacterium]|nr:excalibur calcium-binding domain-containing protein [Kribbellaceae bacterium]
MVLVLVNPFGHSTSTTTAPLYRPTVPTARTAPVTTSATVAPTVAPPTKPRVERTERPVRLEIRTPTPTPTPTPSQSTISTKPVPSTPAPTPTVVVYKTCAEVRAAGKAPLHRGDPGYSEALDRNGDGVACDRGNS